MRFGRGGVRGCGGGSVRKWAFVVLPPLDDPLDPGETMDLVVPFPHLGGDVGETGVGRCGTNGGGGDVEDIFLLLAADGVGLDVHHWPGGLAFQRKAGPE